MCRTRRQYNPILPRWDRIDPLAEKYYNVSPYTYCEDNPIRYIDPNGKEKHDGVGEKNNNNKKLHIMAKEIQDDLNAIVIVATESLTTKVQLIVSILKHIIRKRMCGKTIIFQMERILINY
ncbi:RHS repeat-associated core domain-containing protein [Prevotella dentasini]|uniref:RHS repeat-associated core domain-containing protein n=1 Tax=Prevotella dentasini TaxID=589537 RepID=UPI000469AFB6|nr:RHS repeat-associated core domain-containing protein [Prevotella dentasini]